MFTNDTLPKTQSCVIAVLILRAELALCQCKHNNHIIYSMHAIMNKKVELDLFYCSRIWNIRFKYD